MGKLSVFAAVLAVIVGMTASFARSDSPTSQKPRAGTRRPRGTRVNLVLGRR